jgi:hypothetical protein
MSRTLKIIIMSYKEVRQTQSKKDCNCAGCHKQIKKGGLCIIDPKTKTVICLNCGKTKDKK